MTASKVTDFSKKRTKVKSGKKLLNTEGFAYVVIDKDVNGFNLNIEHLKKYSVNNRYTITVAEVEDNKTILKNYFVDNEDVLKFFQLFQEEKIKGDIIEIDKFNSEILA